MKNYRRQKYSRLLAGVYLCVGQSPLHYLHLSVEAECHVKLHYGTGRSVGLCDDEPTSVSSHVENGALLPVMRFKIKLLTTNKLAYSK